MHVGYSFHFERLINIDYKHIALSLGLQVIVE